MSFKNKGTAKVVHKGGSRLQTRILLYLMLGWFIPLIVTTFVLLFQVVSRIGRQTDRTIQTSMEKASEICNLRFEDCIRASKDSSYHTAIREAWNQYLIDGDKSKLYSDVIVFLEEQYKFNNSFKLTALCFTEEPDTVYSTGMEPLPANFKTDVMPELLAEADGLDTGTGFVNVNGNVYLVRNIMNRKIKPYAVIMIQLNVDQIFESLSSVWEFESYQVFCNDRELTADNGASHDETPRRGDGGVYLTSRDGRDMVVMPGTVEGNRLVYAVTYNGKATRFEQRATVYIFVLNIVFMVPFLIVIIYFFNSKISRPIAELSAAAEQIAGGNYKIVVPENKSGGEISDLTKNFNQMSHQLNEQFNRIFVEEIALRDANIHALQSQINPHFLNNTLEIINWQVRMDGDEKASHMIEALSTMMEATLNREKKQEIPLSRELSYVDAYIYICKCRYGEKFMWSEDVHQDAMKCPVPRLIIQPIVENAVEHAIDEDGRRTVSLCVTQKDGEEPRENTSCLEIRITNHGALSEEDEKRIRILLSDEDEQNEIQGSLSIGIHNVNRRLHIMYGEGSGLTIESSKDGNTVSTIRIKRSIEESC